MSVAASAEDAGPFAPFQFRDYRTLWIASAFSNLGGLIQGVGAGWLMATLTTDAGMVALVQASVTLPVALLSLLAGVLADNFQRRRVMLGALTFMLVMSACLAIATGTGRIGPWGLLLFTFAIGCGAAVHGPSWQASVGDLVPRRYLPAAVTLNGMGFNLMRATGPALGGLIVAALGVATAFAINALSFVPVIAALYFWRPGGVPDPLPRERLGWAVRSGLRYAALSPDIVRIVIRGAMFGLSAVAIIALLPLVARELIGGTSVTYGLLLAAFGLGAVACALNFGRVRARVADGVIVSGAFLLLAIALGALGLGRSLWTAMPAACAAGFGWQFAMSLFNVSIQLASPRWVLGRILALFQLATFGGMAAGSWIWGQVAGGMGPDAALVIAGGACAAGAVAGRLIPFPGTGGLDLTPHKNVGPPPPALDVQMRSGPVRVEVEYQIDEADTALFLGLMARRRVIRKRDGARRWRLHRDLYRPDTWAESYEVPNWAEYLRHRARRTEADAANYQALRALDRRGETTARRWLERPASPFPDR